MAKARHIDEVDFRRTVAAALGSRYPERNRTCLLLSAKAGMRVGEIQALNLEDVWDAEEQHIRSRIHLDASRTKWRHARDVHANNTVRAALSAYIEVRMHRPGPLILNQSSARFTRTVLVNLFRSLYRRAGVQTSSHAGRALFINSLAERGVSIRIIQCAVGHKSLQATNAYLHARPSEVSAAVALLR